MQYNYQAFGNDSKKLTSAWGHKLDPYAILNPCGNVAHSYFNDSYELISVNNGTMKLININTSEISYEVDRKIAFKRDRYYENVQWIDVTNEHFMVWMNMETFPNFIKLWGKIEADLKNGSYIIYIDNKWESKSKDVTKTFIISTAQGLGYATFFGWVLVQFSILLFFSIIVLICVKTYQKDKFDEDDLEW
jgi:hypothetical protein